jgi:ubiquinone/menaquinone biosynthesis C-methylase UbiE
LIKVLGSWDEVGHAINTLRKKGLCLHGDPVKNWDLIQINDILENYDNTINVLDMGCGETNLAVIRFLHQKDLRNCCGIDLSISRKDRLSQIGLMVKNKTLRPPFRLTEGDLTKTKYPSNSFDLIICLSVIEHGVDIESFLKEASRLLKSSGSLYISTDYWEPKLSTNGLNRPFGLSWNIFSKAEIKSLISLSKKYNFQMKNEDIPSTGKKIIHWNDRDFTVISLVLKKE